MWMKKTNLLDMKMFLQKIDMCREHYANNGLGSSYVDQFIR